MGHVRRRSSAANELPSSDFPYVTAATPMNAFPTSANWAPSSQSPDFQSYTLPQPRRKLFRPHPRVRVCCLSGSCLRPLCGFFRRGPGVAIFLIIVVLVTIINLWTILSTNATLANSVIRDRMQSARVQAQDYTSRLLKHPNLNHYEEVNTRKDGRVFVTSGDKHPIPQLMANARIQWEKLKGCQSKTFKQAVTEYRRRNGGRPPPKGFDHWYAFAKAHKVLLIDEFDIISRDMNMFRAFRPSVIRARTDFIERTMDAHWAIRISNGTAIREGLLGHHDRAKGVVDLMTRFVHLLPDMKMLFNGHDNARIPIAWEERNRLEDLIMENRFDDSPEPYRPIERGPAPHHSMPVFCPPDSEVRKPGFAYGWAAPDSTGYEMPPLPDGAMGSFISDFKKYMDICNSPHYRHFHATTSWVYEHEPQVLAPFFTPGVQKGFSDVYGLIVEQLDMEPTHDPRWEDRMFNSLVWRGQTSGPLWVRGEPWKSTQRARLHILSHDEKGKKRVLMAQKGGRVTPVHVPTFKLNAMYLDVGMVGPAVQCIKEDGTCDEMDHVFKHYEPRMSLEKQSLYKYVLDVDGNSWSGRFRRLMMSNAAVVKATIFPEFWTDWAIPWLHFIPMQVDYSDMWDILAFFRGDIRGAGAHDDLGKEIAMAGKRWVKECYRWADLEAFQFRLALEYGRIYNDETHPGSNDFMGDGSVEPIWKGKIKLQ